MHECGRAEEEPLVQRLTAAETTDTDIVRQPEQRHTIAGFKVGELEVAGHVLGDFVGEISLCRRRHQRARPQQLQDLDHARVHLREQVARGVQRTAQRDPVAPLILVRLLLGREQQRSHGLAHHHHLSDHALDVQVLVARRRLRDRRHQADHELGLGQLAAGDLVHHVHDRVGLGEGLIAQARLAVHEQPLPRHQHVVEDHDGVHFLEPRGQRRIEVALAQIVGIARQQLQPRGGNRDGEGKGEGNVLIRALKHGRREDLDFVRRRTERGEQARAPDDDPGVGLAHDVQRDLVIKPPLPGNGVGLVRVEQRVGQHQIVLAGVVIVVAHVLSEVGVPHPALGAKIEPLRSTGEGHQRGVLIIGGPAEHAVRPGCPLVVGLAAPLHVFLGFGQHERHGATVAVLVLVRQGVEQRRVGLAFEEARQRRRSPPRRRVGGHVFDALTAGPDLAVILQPGEVFGGRADALTGAGRVGLKHAVGPPPAKRRAGARLRIPSVSA